MIKKIKEWHKTIDGKANVNVLSYGFIACVVIFIFNLFLPIEDVYVWQVFELALLLEVLCTAFKIEMKINELKENTGKGVVEKWLN